MRFAVFGLVLLMAAGMLYGQSGRGQIYSESGPALEKKDKKNKKDQELPNVEQTQSKTDDPDVIRIDTDLVMIPTRITDRGGKSIADLKKQEFKIFENGVEQQIAYFSGDDQPFTVALVLDMSYSSVFKLSEIQAAAFEFVNQLRRDDKIMVVSFDEKVQILCEPTDNRRALRLAIEGAKISSGTSLYSALDVVLREKLSRITGRKAIILLSDGVDTSSSKLTAIDILNESAETDVLVYPVQYNTYDDVQKTRKESAEVVYDDNGRPFVVQKPKVKGEREEDYKAADKFLREIADQTGGRVFKVSSTTNLNESFSNIAEELRKIYSLGYYPSGERKAGFKYAIKVRVYRPNLVIRARNGYIWNKGQNSLK